MSEWNQGKDSSIVSGVHISNLTRLNNSASGNPRWLVLFSNGMEVKTKRDADVNYGIENSEYKDVPLTVTLEKGEITFVRVR